MQKKNIVIKNNKGIALITLIVAVLMMLVISSMIIYNSLSFLNMSNLNKMYNDIKLLNEQVILYSGVNRNLPILDNAYTAELDASITDGFNKDNFYVLDLNRMNKNLKNSLSFGKDYYSSNFSGKDIYVINKLTYQIFYVKGMKYDNTTYYTVPGKDNYTQITDNLIANPPVLEEGYKSVIWENNAVKEINKYDEKWYNYSI